MKKIVFFFSLFLLSISLFSQEEVTLKNGRTIIVNLDRTWKYKNELPANSTYIDTRDEHLYKTVSIGTQTWMAENLAYKANSGCWAYNNDQSNVKTYGYLYNLKTAKNVCPAGWHLPSDAEWTTLEKTLGSDRAVAGGKLKSTTGWNSPNTGATDSIGFTALPGGERSNDINGTFSDIGNYGYWWSSTETTTDKWEQGIDGKMTKRSSNENSISNYGRRLSYKWSNVYSSNGFGNEYGFSVRCIKDN